MSSVGSTSGAGGMTCAQARLLLAASRRDEWTPAELTALSEHLSTCAACRQKQGAYRGVGEHIRELPTIIPPDSFRASVFAAVEAERVKRESPAARLARADTDPEVPVVRVRPLTRVPQRGSTTTRRAGTTRIVAGLAAALVLAFLGAQAFAGFNPAALTNALSHIVPGSAQPTVASYTLGGQYPVVDSAIAGKQWVVAVASAGAGGEMLVALDRATGKTTPLLSAPVQGPLKIVAMNDTFVVWMQGNPIDTHEDHNHVWNLDVTRLPTHDGANVGSQGFGIGVPDDLPDGTGGYGVLTGVSLSGNTLLMATADDQMGSLVQRSALTAWPVGLEAGPIDRIAAGSAGHLLSDPVVVGSTFYWTDAWLDGSGNLHSALMRSTGPQSAATVVPDGVYGLHVAGNALVYVSAANAQAPTSNDLPALAQTLANVRGTLLARDLTSGKTTQIARNVAVGSLVTSGSVVLYRAADGLHSYDIRSGAPLTVDSSLRHAAFGAVTAEAVAWGGANASSIQVYNLA